MKHNYLLSAYDYKQTQMVISCKIPRQSNSVAIFPISTCGRTVFVSFPDQFHNLVIQASFLFTPVRAGMQQRPFHIPCKNFEQIVFWYTLFFVGM